MIIGLKSLNEQNMVERVIGDFHDLSWVDRVIVVDGCSSDDTVYELEQFSKVEVYRHKWRKEYHDQEVIQSNILMSYVPMGEIYFILDFDERMSSELKQFLEMVNEKGMNTDTISVSRMSYEMLRHRNSTFAITDRDGWPTLGGRIGQYPDYQLRLIKRKLGMHWVNSPHHVLFGIDQGLFTNAPVKADVIHYHGKEDSRERFRIERQWARCQATRKKLGLVADVFECDLSPEMSKYGEPGYWK